MPDICLQIGQLSRPDAVSSNASSLGRAGAWLVLRTRYRFRLGTCPTGASSAPLKRVHFMEGGHGCALPASPSQVTRHEARGRACRPSCNSKLRKQRLAAEPRTPLPRRGRPHGRKPGPRRVSATPQLDTSRVCPGRGQTPTQLHQPRAHRRPERRPSRMQAASRLSSSGERRHEWIPAAAAPRSPRCSIDNGRSRRSWCCLTARHAARPREAQRR